MPTSHTATLLIAHHDRPARRHLAEQLTIDGYDVLEAATERNAVQTLDGYQPEVLLLGGLERPEASASLLRSVRTAALATVSARLPVITLGATDTVSVLRAYETGADHHVAGDVDYVTLRAILVAVLRRCGAADQPTVLEDGALSIDLTRREVRIDGRAVHVPAREFELLRRLAAEPTRVVDKGELLAGIWGYEDASATRTLDSHACRLRKRLASAGHEAVRNTWGVGYSLR